MPEEEVMINFTVPERLKKEFKLWSVENEVPMGEVLEKLIEGILDGDIRIIDFLEEKLGKTLR